MNPIPRKKNKAKPITGARRGDKKSGSVVARGGCKTVMMKTMNRVRIRAEFEEAIFLAKNQIKNVFAQGIRR